MTLLNITLDAADNIEFARAMQRHAWMTCLPGQEGEYEGKDCETRPMPSDFGETVRRLPRPHKFKYSGDIEDPRQTLYIEDGINTQILSSTPVAPANVREFFEALKPLPFEVATLHVRDVGNLSPRAVGQFHFPMGPAVAFKGKGHDRLCSRRLLAMGPWYVHRDEATDLSVIQFHADAITWNDVDWPTAFAQAQRGYYLCDVSIVEHGGRYVVSDLFQTAEAFPLTYDARRRVYRVHQTGETRASSTKMADCNALRFHSRVAPARFAAIEADLRISTRGEDRAAGLLRNTPLLTAPFDEIEFVYDDVASAYADLMELYIRGFPVYAKFPDGERRIDLTFTPPPPPSQPWIEALKARYG